MTDEKNRQPNIEVVDIDSLVADADSTTVNFSWLGRATWGRWQQRATPTTTAPPLLPRQGRCGRPCSGQDMSGTQRAASCAV